MPQDTDKFIVIIKGPGVDIQGKASRELGVRLAKETLDYELSPLDSEAMRSLCGSSSSDHEAPRVAEDPVLASRIEKSGAITNTEVLLVIADAIREDTKVNTVIRAQLLDGFDRAGLKRPKNVDRDIQTAVQRSWLKLTSDSKAKKKKATKKSEKKRLNAWKITPHGTRVLAAMLREAKRKGVKGEGGLR